MDEYKYFLPEGTQLTHRGNVYTIEPLVKGAPLYKGRRREGKITPILGQGGWGITYLASREVTIHNVTEKVFFAIKEFFVKEHCERDELNVVYKVAEDKSFIKTFIHEAERLKNLNHPGIVKVVDVFEANNTAYYVMEYLTGGNLEKRVCPEKDGPVYPLSENEVITIMQPVFQTVHYLHDAHFMHCDIKPENIMMNVDETGKEHAVLIDFGESLHFDRNGNLTSKHRPGFTLGYCPVELQAGIKNFDARCDVYSLAATMFYLLVGQVPVSCHDISPEYIDKHLPSNVSSRMRNTIKHAMRYDIHDRTPNVQALMEELGTAPVPQVLPIGYCLRNGIYDYIIQTQGKIEKNYISYDVLKIERDVPIGTTKRPRHKLYEFFVDGLTERVQNRDLLNVDKKSAEYESFIKRMASNKKNASENMLFEANQTTYYAYLPKKRSLLSYIFAKFPLRAVACIVGVAFVTYGGYYAATHIDWKDLLSQKPSSIEVSNISFDIARIDSLDNIDVAYLKANEMLRFTYSGEATADSIPNGRGTAKFEDGTKYVGLFVNGVCRDTAATFTFTDGSVFKGAVDNYFCMNGRLTDKEGSYFIGHFIKNSPDKSNGTFYFEDGRKKEEVKNLSWDISSNESIPAEDMKLLKSFNMTRYTYSGTTADGVPHGYGIARFGNHTYEGKFVNGLGIDDEAKCFNAADQGHFKGKVMNFMYINGTLDAPNYHYTGDFKNGYPLEK